MLNDRYCKYPLMFIFPSNKLSWGGVEAGNLILISSCQPSPFAYLPSLGSCSFDNCLDCQDGSLVALSTSQTSWEIYTPAARSIATSAAGVTTPGSEGLAPVITASDNLHCLWKTSLCPRQAMLNSRWLCLPCSYILTAGRGASSADSKESLW
jgi:hypothetical protein